MKLDPRLAGVSGEGRSGSVSYLRTFSKKFICTQKPSKHDSAFTKGIQIIYLQKGYRLNQHHYVDWYSLIGIV